jgi:AcrR family transcriptional regulator
VVHLEVSGVETVVQALLDLGPLTDDEAMRLEALVAARREPEVAEALREADRVRRRRLQPLFEAASRDGTIAPGLDAGTVLFLVRTIYLGLLLQRGAGSEPPDPEAWEALVRLVADAIAGRPGGEPVSNGRRHRVAAGQPTSVDDPSAEEWGGRR